jgi:cell division protein FtsI/penicillin-binding protein 2
VLAVIERPGGFDRALQGVFPPGSTFKVVTASALSGTGLRPASPVQCPAQVNIGGRVFHNFDNEHLGAISLQTAFAVSCNSTFITLATQRLSGSTLASTAATFGFNSQPNLGIPATLGRFTTPHTQVDLAADAFGQGTDLVNPLSEASMAGAVEDGTWRPPQLVLSPAPKQTAQPQQLSSTVLATLRPMMRAVVTTGTAANVGFQAGVFGKTGTAEFGTSQNPRSHAWFVGYRGDLAFAVLVEGGGVGADASAPIANAFLRNL